MSRFAAVVVFLAIAGGCSDWAQKPIEQSRPSWKPPPGMGAFVAVEEIGPVAPVRAEGDHHLFYELRLTSFDPRLLVLDSLQIMDEESSRVLTAYGASELREMIIAPGSTVGSDPTRILPGSHSVVFLWLNLGPERPPAHLRHRLLLRDPEASEHGIHRLEADPTPVSAEAPLVVGPPLRGGPWYAHAGPDNASHHRRTLAPRDGRLTMDQRFASDWTLLREDVAESGEVSYVAPDWAGTIGSEVLSVGDGRVVATLDGIPDDRIGPLAPGEVIDWETICGNRVTIGLGEGQFAWYCHLQEGTLRVKPGDWVRRGDVLARIGNSGNSYAPHLHFDITDSDTLGKGRGLPFAFACFDLMARADHMPGYEEMEVAARAERTLWDPPLRPRQGADRRRKLELPLGGAVVVFPEELYLDGERECR
jgi:murein DD-endopeptidase